MQRDESLFGCAQCTRGLRSAPALAVRNADRRDVAALAAAFLILAGINDSTAHYSAHDCDRRDRRGALSFAACAGRSYGGKPRSPSDSSAVRSPLWFRSDATAHVYGNFLGLLSTWAAPWAAIMIASREGALERVKHMGLIAWLAGIAAGLPFWQQFVVRRSDRRCTSAAPATSAIS